MIELLNTLGRALKRIFTRKTRDPELKKFPWEEDGEETALRFIFAPSKQGKSHFSKPETERAKEDV
jgi:hypothetical protein